MERRTRHDLAVLRPTRCPYDGVRLHHATVVGLRRPGSGIHTNTAPSNSQPVSNTDSPVTDSATSIAIANLDPDPTVTDSN